MQPVEESAQRADGNRKSDSPQPDTEVDDLQRDNVWLVSEQGKEVGRGWPQGEEHQANKTTQIQPLPGDQRTFVRRSPPQGLSGERAHALRNAQRQGGERIGNNTGRHGRGQFSRADLGYHPGIDKANHGV